MIWLLAFVAWGAIAMCIVLLNSNRLLLRELAIAQDIADRAITKLEREVTR